MFNYVVLSVLLNSSFRRSALNVAMLHSKSYSLCSLAGSSNPSLTLTRVMSPDYLPFLGIARPSATLSWTLQERRSPRTNLGARGTGMICLFC